MMDIAEAQRDVRTVFLRGSVGQLVSGLLWLGSAALGTWYSHRSAIGFLVIGGIFIFPLTQLVLRAMGRPASLPTGHPMNGLAMQVAFTVPLNLFVVAGATMYRLNWFYPALMIVVGAHYLPFIFLYGMWQFGLLAAALITAGWAIGVYVPHPFSLGGWVAAFALLAFALVSRQAARPSL
jgi:hypothetical protein